MANFNVGKPRKDLTGQRFTKLLVTEYAGYVFDDKGRAKHLWKCKCDCGNEVIVKGGNLLRGKRSCGCIPIVNKNPWHTHRLSKTPIYQMWHSMKGRCNNPNDAAYKYYGGKGVKVCNEWLNSFTAFYNWAIENGYDVNNKKDCQIDRIDHDGNYCPENCRIVDRYTQANNKSNNRRELVNGEMLTLREAYAKYCNIGFPTVKSRIDNGWSIEKAVLTPLMNQGYCKKN